MKEYSQKGTYFEKKIKEAIDTYDCDKIGMYGKTLTLDQLVRNISFFLFDYLVSFQLRSHLLRKDF